MRIGIMQGTDESSLDALIQTARRIEAKGFSTLWLANIFSWDAITALAIIGRETSRSELGTAVVPSYPRHPMAMAQQALTAGAATGGRFTLGIGLSHQIGIENMAWSTDFPHHGNDWPYSRKTIDTLFADVPTDERRKIVCTNAARFWGLMS